MADRPSKIDDAELLAAAEAADNVRQLLRALGIAAYGGNDDVVRQRLAALGVEDERFRPRLRPPAYPADALADAVARADSWTEAARRLGDVSPGAARRVRRQAVAAGLDTRHMRGQGWARGGRLGGRDAAPLDEVLVAGRRASTTTLRLRLLREGVLLPQCAICAGETWQGAPIPLELDHVNGDRTDNRLGNLRLLCPNCHAQTPTYRGRNIGAPRRPPPPAASRDLAPSRRSLQRLAAVLGPRS